MKLGKQTSDDDLELDMSPMIDMVFLLLIFFIVVFRLSMKSHELKFRMQHMQKYRKIQRVDS